MTNYEAMKHLLSCFSEKYARNTNVESDLYTVSKNDAVLDKIIYLYDRPYKNLKVMDMDAIAHSPYRASRFLESTKESEAPASIDAFLISAEDKWYFIEFKDQKIAAAKDSVTKKAYANWYWLMDILYEMMGTCTYPTFRYDNPIAFAKDRIIYILVVSEEKNSLETKKMHDCELAGEKFLPEYMKKLEKYVYHEAFVYTPRLFEKEFVKKFVY
ncbi:MAG: hypothetical protein NC355_03285 [Blautia sp.]|nr:hypothetical protein [Blautia sp.]